MEKKGKLIFAVCLITALCLTNCNTRAYNDGDNYAESLCDMYNSGAGENDKEILIRLNSIYFKDSTSFAEFEKGYFDFIENNKCNEIEKLKYEINQMRFVFENYEQIIEEGSFGSTDYNFNKP